MGQAGSLELKENILKEIIFLSWALPQHPGDTAAVSVEPVMSRDPFRFCLLPGLIIFGCVFDDSCKSS